MLCSQLHFVGRPFCINMNNKDIIAFPSENNVNYVELSSCLCCIRKLHIKRQGRNENLLFLINKESLFNLSNVRLFEIILKVLLKMHEIFDIQDCVV